MKEPGHSFFYFFFTQTQITTVFANIQQQEQQRIHSTSSQLHAFVQFNPTTFESNWIGPHSTASDCFRPYPTASKPILFASVPKTFDYGRNPFVNTVFIQTESKRILTTHSSAFYHVWLHPTESDRNHLHSTGFISESLRNIRLQ